MLVGTGAGMDMGALAEAGSSGSRRAGAEVRALLSRRVAGRSTPRRRDGWRRGGADVADSTA